MAGIREDPKPFFNNPNTHVALFHGEREDGLPVVVKKHHFYLLQDPNTQKAITRCLNAALLQGKLQHPNVCDVLEIGFEIEQKSCIISHVLEALDTDLAKDIKQRTEAQRPYTETEVRDIALQTASALAYSHSKNLAHRDVKPGNIFRTGPTYKLGDFGCFFVKQDTSYTASYAGDQRYMSPQLLEACVRRTPYNAFKTDVYALGASLLHVVTGSSPEPLLQAPAQVTRALQRLSPQLRDLLSRMLAVEEEQRPTMQEVCALLSAPVPVPVSGQTKTLQQLMPMEEGKNRETDLLRRQEDLQTQLKEAQLLLEEGKSNTQLVDITKTALRYFDFQAGTWQPLVNLQQKIDIYPYFSTWVVLEGGGIFVCYGNKAWVLSGSGAVVCSTRMRKKRFNPGVIALPNTPVLIFGGNLQSGSKSYSQTVRAIPRL